MSWNLATRLYVAINGSGPALLEKTETGFVAWPGKFPFKQGTTSPLEIMFVDRSVTPPVVVPLDAAFTTIIFSAKQLSGNIQDTTLLFSATGFASFTEGDVTGYRADELNLNTTALNTLMDDTAAGTDLTVRCEVRCQNAGNTLRLPIHFIATVEEHVYAGEGAPEAADPAWPLPGDIITTAYITPNVTILEEGGDLVWRWNGVEIQRRSAS